VALGPGIPSSTEEESLTFKGVFRDALRRHVQ